MNRGKPVKAEYGDKGGVYIPSKSEFGNEHDFYLDAVCIGMLKVRKRECLIVVFLQSSGTNIKRGDIHTISARQWHGSAYLE